MNNVATAEAPVIAAPSVEVKVSVKESDLKSLLVSALEGGSNYWYMLAKREYTLAPDVTMKDFGKGGKHFDADYYEHTIYCIPFVPGCALHFNDNEGDDPKKVYSLTRENITSGLEVMYKKYPHHFADIISENDDAMTADVFLQCALFGDIVYG